MPVPFKYIGTISHGTLRAQDLVPRYFEVLSDLDFGRAQIIAAAYPEFFEKQGFGPRTLASDLDRLECEDGSELLDSLDTALGEQAPEGYVFGAIEGDGSDFGFWRDDTYDLPEEER